MMRFLNYRVLLIGVLFVCLNAAYAENWPGWRGPRGDGTSLDKNVPTEWDATTNVVWKTAVPGVGYASPIVWGDRVFTATAVGKTKQRLLLCFDRTTGEILWQKTVLRASLERVHRDNSYASGTPATDGEKVYVSFLDGRDVVVAAYDFSGNQVWLVRPGTFSSPHGYSCSPVLYKDKVIINGASKKDAFVVALSRQDGRVLWNFPLDKPALSYSTPLIGQMAGRTQMIFCGNKSVAGYDPDDGARLWWVDGPSDEFVATPTYNERSGLLFISSGYPQRHLLAIRPDGQGNVTKTHVAWRTKDGAVYVPSLTAVDDYVLTTSMAGVTYCFEAATGKLLWKEELGKQYPSPVVASGRVYIPNDEGVINVIKPGPTLVRLARNDIEEKTNASPAISDGQIFLRGDKHLFCIGKRASESASARMR